MKSPKIYNNVFLNKNGFWCRICPKCKKETEYSRKDNAVQSEIKNRNCMICHTNYLTKKSNIKLITRKHRKKQVDGIFFKEHIKKWCRICSFCKKEVEYTCRYQAILYEKKSAPCIECSWNRYESPIEKEFLDHYGIIKRQQSIDSMVVDGIIDNTIYEFLGDYWHGNPERYNLGDMNKAKGVTYGFLYNKTMERLNRLRSIGYEVFYIWESDWVKYKKRLVTEPKLNRLY